MDFLDRASEREHVFREDALARHRALRPTTDGCAECRHCGDEIPEARRRAVAATLCIDCQRDVERVD